MTHKLNVLFLCTGNSCRSQMAEGWTRHLHGNRFNAYSAGVLKTALNQHAAAVMGESGVDISSHWSKEVSELSQVQFDYVITVCGHAHETCPLFPGKAAVIHHGFDDPPTLTAGMPDGEAKLDVYRRVRDEIRKFVQTLPERLNQAKQTGEYHEQS